MHTVSLNTREVGAVSQSFDHVPMPADAVFLDAEKVMKTEMVAHGLLR